MITVYQAPTSKTYSPYKLIEMNRNIPLKTFFTTSTDITKSYFGISAARQVQEQQMQMQMYTEQQKDLNLYKQELMNVMKDYIAQKLTRIQTVDKLDDLQGLVRAVTTA